LARKGTSSFWKPDPPFSGLQILQMTFEGTPRGHFLLLHTKVVCEPSYFFFLCRLYLLSVHPSLSVPPPFPSSLLYLFAGSQSRSRTLFSSSRIWTLSGSFPLRDTGQSFHFFSVRVGGRSDRRADVAPAFFGPTLGPMVWFSLAMLLFCAILVLLRGSFSYPRSSIFLFAFLFSFPSAVICLYFFYFFSSCSL